VGPRGSRRVAFLTATVAVLAAVGTVAAHHRSIQALSVRTDGLLLTIKASDQYHYYDTKLIKATLYQALKMPKEANAQQQAALRTYGDAIKLENKADAEVEHSVRLLQSFELLEVATTLFEISIAFGSLAALTGMRFALWFAAGLSLVGVVAGIYGYAVGH